MTAVPAGGTGLRLSPPRVPFLHRANSPRGRAAFVGSPGSETHRHKSNPVRTTFLVHSVRSSTLSQTQDSASAAHQEAMRKRTRPHQYESLAQYYDQFFTFHVQWYRTARRKVLGSILRRTGSACDLACGTGTTALELARR